MNAVGTVVLTGVASLGIHDFDGASVYLGLICGVAALLSWVVLAFAVLSAKSQALEIDTRGFRTYDAFGRRARDCPWNDLDRFLITRGNTPFSPGGELRLAWRCRDGTPGACHRRKNYGDEVDGMTFDKQDRPVAELLELLLECQEAFAPETVSGRDGTEQFSRVASPRAF